MRRERPKREVRDVQRLRDRVLDLQGERVGGRVGRREEAHADHVLARQLGELDVVQAFETAQRGVLLVVARMGRVLRAGDLHHRHQARGLGVLEAAPHDAIGEQALLQEASLARAEEARAVEHDRGRVHRELVEHVRDAELRAPGRDHHAHAARVELAQRAEHARADAALVGDERPVEIEHERLVRAAHSDFFFSLAGALVGAGLSLTAGLSLDLPESFAPSAGFLSASAAFLYESER